MVPPIAAGLALLLNGSPAGAAAEPTPPPLSTLRYDEDYGHLGRTHSSSAAWWTPLKYLPIIEDDELALFLTLGLEVWFRTESYEAIEWAPQSNDTFLWGRVLPYADIHFGGLRGFVQLIAARSIGLDEPGPIDQNSLDLLQGFVEFDAYPDDARDLSVRVGRQLVRLGSGRLVDIRYGVNVLEPFDGARLMLDIGHLQLDLLYLQPADLGIGVFDDGIRSDEALWGAYLTLFADRDRDIGVDMYYLGYRNGDASFQSVQGHEVRHTVGVRGFGHFDPFAMNYELFVQTGSVDSSDDARPFASILAWSLATDTAVRFDLPGRPALGLRFNVVSGDGRPDDDTLGTFNPLFPRGKYFGELTPLGPANLLNIHPNLRIQLADNVTLASNIVWYWRYSPNDAVYALSGLVLRAGQGSRARFVGTQWDLVLEHQASRTFDYVASYSQFHAGSFIRETGPASTTRFVAVEARFRF